MFVFMMILLGLLGLLLLGGLLALVGNLIGSVWYAFFPEKLYVPDNWREKMYEEEAQKHKLQWENIRTRAAEEKAQFHSPREQ